MADNPQYHLYLLLCDDSILYTGIAIDPLERLKQHQNGHPHGAKFTRRFKRLELVYYVKTGGRSMAQKLEYHFKKCTRKKKMEIIKKNPSLEKLKAMILT